MGGIAFSESFTWSFSFRTLSEFTIFHRSGLGDDEGGIRCVFQLSLINRLTIAGCYNRTLIEYSKNGVIMALALI